MDEEFVYTIEKGTAQIDKVRRPKTLTVIPENIGGYPVTSLGAYALAGSDVKELHLPVRLKKIGAYAFYNCGQLQRIFCGSRILDLGAGLFAGAGGVEFLDFTLFEGEKSCLKDLLSELRQTLRVRIHLAGSGREARLMFPEYFEESVENTPARILYIETHGCGHRYRYCFSGTQFPYQSYDELFCHAKVQEPEALVAELAIGRLQYPYDLTEKNERMYREYVAEHWQTAARLMLEADSLAGREGSLVDPGGIPWLVQEVLKGGRSKEENSSENAEQEDKLRQLVRMAQQAGDTEAVAWLMNFQHQSSTPKRRRFEL